MKVLIVILAITTASYSFAGTSMKLEGTCYGTLEDSSTVSFTYYSNFNGCKKRVRAAIAFTDGDYSNQGLFTGRRYFKNGKDLYSFQVRDGHKRVEKVRLEFNDSTGNLGGMFKAENSEVVPVSCEIRDYEYIDC